MHGSPRRDSYSRSRSASKRKDDSAVSMMTKLVERQGELLKNLSGRIDKISSALSQVTADKVTRSGAENVISVDESDEDSNSDTDQFQVRVGANERIGDSDDLLVVSRYLQIICKKDTLEIHHPKFENSRLGFIESVHER